jgi:hypothetical protein
LTLPKGQKTARLTMDITEPPAVELKFRLLQA